jgi:beta-lactamase regulating signal transducer with metallopeptidase domain
MILAVIQSSIILMVGLTAVQIFRRQSAAVRHLILAAAVIAALVVPALPPLSLARQTGPTRIDSIFPSVAVSNVDEGIDHPLAPLVARNDTVREVVWDIWLAGVGIGAIFFITGAVRVRVIFHRSRPLSGTPWMRAMSTVSGRLGMSRHVRLRQNDEGLQGTYGIFRPTVLVSPEAGTWNDDEISIVLTHEFAHIRRLDWPIQMLAEISRALYWFNPLIWIVCRRLRYESELACDDAVLNTGIDPKDYAGHLLNLARAFKNSGRSWSPVVAMAQPPNLERRFLAMLNASVNHRPPHWLLWESALQRFSPCCRWPRCGQRKKHLPQHLQ